MRASRILKIYGNRRIFDLAEHRYITFQGLRKLINRNIHFVVEHHGTGADRTRTTVLEAVCEQLSTRASAPLLTVDFIRELICLSDTCDPALVRKALDKMAETIGSAVPITEPADK